MRAVDARESDTESSLPAVRPGHGAELHVRGAVKRFGSFAALRGVDLTVQRGEFMTLLGPSGSGKTTLLNAIAGFEDLDGGEISSNGQPLRGLPPHRRGFGMVFQSYALFPQMTVLENVAYPLRLRGDSRSERTTKAHEVLQLVELDQFASRLPAQLSGGQQQRVALARAIVYAPSVLLMDEPLGALDRRLRQALQFSIKDLHRDLGTTIVYVTHDQEEALAMSDRIAVMRNGVIEQVDVPANVYLRPSSSFIAQFLGDTNFLNVKFEHASSRGHVVRHVESGQLFTVDTILGEGQSTLSIRPESFDICPVGDTTNDGLRATVTSKTFMGESLRYECQIGSAASVIVRTGHDRSGIRDGQDVLLTMREGEAIAFDQAGERINSCRSDDESMAINQQRKDTRET